MEKVAVGSVDLDEVDWQVNQFLVPVWRIYFVHKLTAGFLAPFNSCCKGVLYVLHVGLSHSMRLWIIFCVWNVAGPKDYIDVNISPAKNRQFLTFMWPAAIAPFRNIWFGHARFSNVRMHPRCNCGCFSTRVGQLNPYFCSLSMCKFDNTLQRGYLWVSPNALFLLWITSFGEKLNLTYSILRRDTPFRQNSSGLHTHCSCSSCSKSLPKLRVCLYPPKWQKLTPMWTRCQSVACPLSLLYWHIGD